MRITFSQTGGIVPIKRGCQLDSDELPAEIRHPLEGFFRRCANANPLAFAPSPRGADIPSYRILVEDGRDVAKYEFNELNIPDSVRPAIDYLLERSRPQSFRD